jgi:hypothetical protein
VPVRYASRDPPRRPPPREEPSPRAVLYAPEPRGEAPVPPPVPPRSHAAAFVAVALVLLGAWLAAWSILVPGLLALLLLSSGLGFLSARLNPLSIGFYLTTKPSWSAIGVVFLSGVLLLGIAYNAWTAGWGPILPARWVP